MASPLRAALALLLVAAWAAAKSGKGSAQSPTDLNPGFQVTTLVANACNTKVRRGDAVRAKISAAAGAVHEQAAASEVADYGFIVGKHQISAINHGVIGMCPGDTRVVRVNSHAIDYKVTLSRIESGPLRIKSEL
eukprot:TRINITY_DN97548_c0_g1_i1.p1 TRINITY_DN97548_c0_g1~~TRINITY_DN97548_c0_g1_i1.p1  ORF type:complete len:135 (-),score=31.80 TRINITY_DN97548_c0_g1_i1:66-470(-)